MPSLVGFIPLRSESKRIPNKNVRLLAGAPLFAYTVAQARESGVFRELYVSTNSEEYAELVELYGVKALMCPLTVAHKDTDPDYLWLDNAVGQIAPHDSFSILRVTSPFRTADTIRRAWEAFTKEPNSYDSLRAVEKCKQHPNKMWVRNGAQIIPYNAQTVSANGITQPAHSVPTQLLPEVLVQNASLEIAWTSTLTKHKNISGTRVLPFFTEGYEGYDINTPEDWDYAEWLIMTERATLPEVHKLDKQEAPVRRKKVK